MKDYLLLCFFIMFSTLLSAQINLDRQVLAFVGGFGTDSEVNLNVSWTVGEITTETFESTEADIILTQGFQQWDTTDIISSIKNVALQEIGLSVFPNPVSQSLTIHQNSSNTRELSVKLIDLSGKVLRVKKLSGVSTQIDMSNLPSTMYLLHFTDTEGRSAFYKVLKTTDH